MKEVIIDYVSRIEVAPITTDGHPYWDYAQRRIVIHTDRGETTTITLRATEDESLDVLLP